MIVIVDGHCELEGRGYLREVAGVFRRSSADCLGRPQPLDVTGASTLQQAIAAARSCWLGHHPDSFIYSATEQFVPAKSVAAAYKRTVFDRVGEFDESFDACEDVEFNHRVDRAGLRCFFTSRCRFAISPGRACGASFSSWRYGRGRVRLLRKHPDTFSPGGFVPAAWVAGLIAGPLVGLVWFPLWWLYGGLIAVYLAIVAATSATIAVQHRKPEFLGWLPLVFLTIHAGSGCGVLTEVFSGRSRRGGN